MGRAKRRLALMPSAWMEHAACASHGDPDLWFPHGDRQREAEAAAICRRECSVPARCLAYALGNSIESGVWGGTTEDERRQMRDKRAVAS
jgi:WhiB family transcriptional regulator, redox-sensing transcriptional regulator